MIVIRRIIMLGKMLGGGEKIEKRVMTRLVNTIGIKKKRNCRIFVFPFRRAYAIDTLRTIRETLTLF